MQKLLRNGRSKISCQNLDCLTYYFDISFILACNRISLIPFNSLQYQLLFDVLCFKMDQVAMKVSTTNKLKAN